MFMGSNYALEVEVDNRLANLDKTVDSLGTDHDQSSFSRKDFVHELRDRVNASRRMLLVAKLLSEPARESMFSKVRDSLCVVEALIASQLSGKTNLPYSACSPGELAYAGHIRPHGRA